MQMKRQLIYMLYW